MRPAPVLLALCLASCGYFNAMYNAQRRFDDAQRAERRGESAAATRAYRDAIDKAASSYRGHPEGRWADDALYLIGRARFALGEDEAASAAFRTLLDGRADPELLAGARAHLGAAGVRLGDVRRAEADLDAAIADRAPGSELIAFARLWRARARFARGADADAWSDLESAAAAASPVAIEAGLEGLGRAVIGEDSARARTLARRLYSARGAAGSTDSIAGIVRTASRRFGAGQVRTWLEDIERSPWPAPQREPHALLRIELLAVTGDTAAAVADALDLAGRADARLGGRARELAARLMLATADSFPQLEPVRAALLPALDQPEARALVRAIKTVEVLLERAADGQVLAIFAAAEIARDELGARRLARELFLAYADIVPDAVWAPKALLAAGDLTAREGPHADIASRVRRHSDNIYVQAISTSVDADAFATAEQRLDRSLTALREDARRAADQRDARVTSAVARLDSLKTLALADSVRLACGSLLDSLAVTGIRADSMRAACVRGDTARLGVLARTDTLLLRDSARARPDTTRAGRRVVRDTLAPRSE